MENSQVLKTQKNPKVNFLQNYIHLTILYQANILDTKAEVLWKLGKNDEAVKIIEMAIQLNPDNDYFIEQKDKLIALMKEYIAKKKKIIIITHFSNH